jgi:hypothetical protein
LCAEAFVLYDIHLEYGKYNVYRKSAKPGIDCARLPREAMFVTLPRKVDTILPRANLARVEPNRSSSLSRDKGISVCCALSVEMVLWRSGVSFAASINSHKRLARFDAGHEHGY